MTPDTTDTDETTDRRRDTFTPPVRDYFDRRIADDHDANQVLHDTLQAADDDRIGSVNLLASHAPHGPERDAKGQPRYHVRVRIENDGTGHPVIGATIVGDMVDRGDVRITNIPECSRAHLAVDLRPVIHTVEPVEVPVADVPDRIRGIDHDTLRHRVKKVLSEVADAPKTDEQGVYEAASALATLLHATDPDRDGGRLPEGGMAELEWLTDEVDVPWHFEDDDSGTQITFERTDPPGGAYHCITVDGEPWEHGDIESPAHAAKAATRLLETHVSDTAADAFLYGVTAVDNDDLTDDVEAVLRDVANDYTGGDDGE